MVGGSVKTRAVGIVDFQTCLEESPLQVVLFLAEAGAQTTFLSRIIGA